MSIHPISNFSGTDAIWARNDVFTNEEIVRLIASFLDRAQDRISLGSTNHRVYSIIFDPLALSFRSLLPGFFTASRRNNLPSHAGPHGTPPSLGTLGTREPLNIASSRYEPSSQTSGSLSPSTSPSETISIFSTLPPGNIRIWDMPSDGLLSLAPQSSPSGPIIHNGRLISSFGSGPQRLRPTGLTGEDSEEESLPNYTNFVQTTNDLRHEIAIENNTDGGKYLKSVIDEHMQTLSDNERVEFKKKIEEIDEELFTVIPHLAVKKAISSTVPLTRKNIPLFMHAHLGQLEQLRQKQKSLTAADLRKECGIIATKLQRETDCIASMQKAFQSFS